MAVPTSRFVPRPRARLDWSADPSASWGDRSKLNPAMVRAGMDFNRALYAPDSATMRVQRPAPPSISYPTGWQSTSRPQDIASRYGTPGLPTRGQVARIVSSRSPDPTLSYPNDAATGDFPGVTFQDGYGNVIWNEKNSPSSHTPSPENPIENPNLLADATDTSFQDGPWTDDSIDQTSQDQTLHTMPANDLGTPIRQSTTQQKSDNPLDQQQSARETAPRRQRQDSTERFYDRKFGRESHDPATQMQSRLTRPGAPNVSKPINPIRFNNEVGGHSSWQPYP